MNMPLYYVDVIFLTLKGFTALLYSTIATHFVYYRQMFVDSQSKTCFDEFLSENQ